MRQGKKSRNRGNGEADRNLFCSNYGYCLSEACDLGFPGFDCTGCPSEKDRYTPPETGLREWNLILTLFTKQILKRGRVPILHERYDSGPDPENLTHFFYM